MSDPRWLRFLYDFAEVVDVHTLNHDRETRRLIVACLGRLDQLIAVGDNCEIVMMAYRIGQLAGEKGDGIYRALHQKRQEHAQAMGKSRKLSPEEVKRRKREWQAEVESLMRRNANLKYTAATDRLGRKLGFSTGRQVRKFTTDPTNKTGN